LKTRDSATDTSFAILTHISDEITELPKIDTEINPKISDVTSISETSKDIFSAQEIKNMIPHLAQQENNISFLIKSNSQILIGGIGTISIVASILMPSLSAYIFFTLLIIAVI